MIRIIKITEIELYYGIKDQSYDKFLEKHGKDNYKWLKANPNIRNTGSCRCGYKMHHYHYIYTGLAKDKKRLYWISLYY